jgi:hypothetical protein
MIDARMADEEPTLPAAERVPTVEPEPAPEPPPVAAPAAAAEPPPAVVDPLPARATALARAALAAEAVLVLAGVALRLRLAVRYDAHWGLDWLAHFAYLQWVVTHHSLPLVTTIRTAYHPPLAYWLGAELIRHGARPESVRWISVGAGVGSLGLTWLGLRLYLPRHAPARLFALALAAVLPASVLLDMVVSNEPVNRLCGTLVLVLVPWVFDERAPRPWLRALPLGAALALAALAKVSAVVLIAAVGLGGVLGLLRSGGWRRRLARLAPAAIAVGLSLSTVVPLALRTHGDTGHWFATGYDGAAWGQKRLASLAKTSYWKRRPLDYVYGLGGGRVLREPYVVRQGRCDPHFLPVLLATTFADYYDFGFAPAERLTSGADAVLTSHASLSPRAVRLMRGSVEAGLLLAVAMLCAVPGVLVAIWRRRDIGALLLLVVPALALLGQLDFAVRYPYDDQGPVKGLYMMFAAAPLFGLTGLAFDRLVRRPVGVPLALALAGALALIARYTLFAVGLL